ncbi:MAG: beta-galactosidase [Candidatus Brocadiia bacterium]
MKLGVAYYPEQWPENQWEKDLDMMADIGMEVVRLGEFAWFRLEPRRERYEFEWLENVIELTGERGFEIVLGTPTAAPPPWLFNRHPNIMPQDREGNVWYMGSRRHVCINNTAYLKYVRRIVNELARQFGRDERISAWQIDNELALGPTGLCYCEECEKEFTRWLKRRYGTIERLNRMWGTAVWSQGFSDWHEIPAPKRTTCGPHPSLALDYKRFFSARCRAFVEEQKEMIKRYAGEDVVVTVNEPEGFALPHIDLFTLSEAETVASLDNYPSDADRRHNAALGLDLARSLHKKPFWVLEQQAGAPLIREHAQQPRPGQLRLWSYQAAAHGAETIVYFRWRTAAAGQEMHWNGIIDSDGIPRRRFDELKATISELKAKAEAWEGHLPEARVAIALDYNSAWALEATPLAMHPDYFEQARMFHRILRGFGVAVDFADVQKDLKNYDIVLLPMPFIAVASLAKNLERFVREGGGVLVTAPAGYKTQANTNAENRRPGCLSQLLGVEVVEHDVLNSRISNSVRFKEEDQEYKVEEFCSILELQGAEALAFYTDQYYAESAAITVQKVEKGYSYFVAADVGEECYRELIGMLLEDNEIQVHDWGDDDVEIIPLSVEGEEERIFVLNHSANEVKLESEDTAAKDILTGKKNGEIILEPYGVAIVVKK